ncbi:unnamed protein product [Dovyalis caffra]|uniref:Sorting nexin/Vps5-like C-terminal domain-containing protein n=1 Tax=Dovyalis caffra TaxID=77055 RepID=A0AAV1SBZ2_9ROSI|nr:unnamed protein product [Dovyalis caffra]
MEGLVSKIEVERGWGERVESRHTVVIVDRRVLLKLTNGPDKPFVRIIPRRDDINGLGNAIVKEVEKDQEENVRQLIGVLHPEGSVEDVYKAEVAWLPETSNLIISKIYGSIYFLSEMGQSLLDFGKAAKLLGACEEDALGKAFSKLATKSDALSVKLLKEAHQLLMNFQEPLKDYVSAVQSIKASLATVAERANAFRLQFEPAETIKLKEINLDKLVPARSDKAAEAEHADEEANYLMSESEEATRRFETIVRQMNEEIVRFQEQKTLDMGIALHEFAEGQHVWPIALQMLGEVFFLNLKRVPLMNTKK